MKIQRISIIALVASSMAFSACGPLNNTGKGGLIGAGGGAAIGAGIGALIGGGKGAAIGAAVGGGVGAGAGALIGRKMDKQQAQLEQELADKAKVEQVTDANGLQAIKVTFESGILFPTNGTSINESAKKELKQFAQSLTTNPGTIVQIYGFTDNTGTMKVNTNVANGRAASVMTYLVKCGVEKDRLTSEGKPMSDYVASNDTSAGRAANRRVEIYISAGKEMIQKAEEGTLQ